MKKRILSALASTLAVALLVTACGAPNEGNQKESEKETVESVAVDESKASDKTSAEPTVLTVFIREDSGYDYETNLMTLYLEEKFNVDLQFEQYSKTEGLDTAYNLMLASGEYPDIILGGALSAAQILAGAEAGALVPLGDYIIEGTSYKKALDENPEWVDYLTSSDGNIYTFPHTDSGKHMVSKNKMFYRADWLEKLGWENPPSTTEEFKQFLVDIRDNDVNGNGDPDDEIPLAGFVSNNNTDPVFFLMCPFELATNNFYHITDDGELYFEAITDGWRKGLAYIADLYAEGLLAEETFIQDQTTFKALLNKPSEEALIGAFPRFYRGVIDKNVMSWYSYLPLAPLKGDYQQTAARMGDSTFSCIGAISTDCEHPDLAFEILDYLISKEGTRLGKSGLEGVTWEYSDEMSFLGTSPSVKNIAKEKGITNTVWYSAQFPCYDTVEIRYGVLKDEALKETNSTQILLEAAEVYEPYYVCDNVPQVVWADDELIIEKAEYSTLINEYIKVSYTEFILGIRDINDDKQWKAYLDELDAMGLEKYIDILNTYYGLK